MKNEVVKNTDPGYASVTLDGKAACEIALAVYQIYLKSQQPPLFMAESFEEWCDRQIALVDRRASKL
jgi:hypothetical protein